MPRCSHNDTWTYIFYNYKFLSVTLIYKNLRSCVLVVVDSETIETFAITIRVLAWQHDIAFLSRRINSFPYQSYTNQYTYDYYFILFLHNALNVTGTRLIVFNDM